MNVDPTMKYPIQYEPLFNLKSSPADMTILQYLFPHRKQTPRFY